ncbi:MAG TPA: hypothetical protein VFR40_13085, partial [Lapillicoccus sp.]|nr:hypothetical protein [Lapillicoccus sp.]
MVQRGLVLLERHPDTSEEWLHARARLLITRAFSEFEVHGLDRGDAALVEAAAAAAVCESRDVDALVHELRGLIAVRSGRLEDSLAEFDGSVALLPHLEPEDRPTVLLNRGAVQLLRKDLRAARSDLADCARLAAEQGMSHLEFKAQHNLGYAEFLAGDIPAALRAFALADALDTDVSRSVWFLDRARVLMEAGLLEEADQALADASDLLRRERANQDRAEAELARAEVALLQGDWSLAKTHSTRARRDFRRRQSVGWQARADVTRWQAHLDSKGGPARVAREIRTAMSASDGADRQVDELARSELLARQEQADAHGAALPGYRHLHDGVFRDQRGDGFPHAGVTPQTMRALTWQGTHDVRVDTVPDPTIQEPTDA